MFCVLGFLATDICFHGCQNVNYISGPEQKPPLNRIMTPEHTTGRGRLVDIISMTNVLAL